MADQDIKMLIERIMAEARTHQSARFSHEVYADEPILKTGRQMQNFLPDQYRKMREISRWQDDPKGGAGRWLSEAELFYRQGLLMADFEDDCPYNGTFKSYFPTYNAMSDRQLRGYFTWRAQVRRGTVEETSTSTTFSPGWSSTMPPGRAGWRGMSLRPPSSRIPPVRKVSLRRAPPASRSRPRAA